jgi:hypothetical protein
MPALIRRRIPDARSEAWRVFYGDVPVGTIGVRSGVPVHVDQWGWSCGFSPGLNPGQHHDGSAATFERARAAFEEAWRKLLPKIPEGAFAEYRRDRAWRAEVAAARERGEKLPSEVPISMMRCVCGVKFDSHRPDESLPHRRHIYAAQSSDGTPR